MNILSLLAFTTFIFSVLVALFILRISLREPITITYSLLSAVIGLWGFSYAFIYPETDPAKLWFFYRLSSPGWILVQSLALHFVLILTDSPLQRKKLFFLLLYGAPAVLMGRLFYGDLLIAGFKSGPWGTAEVPAETGFWKILLIVYILAAFFSRIAALVVFMRKTTRKNLRKQSLIFMITDMSVFIMSYLMNVLIPSLPGNSFPSMGAAAAVLIPLSVWYSIKNHKLFSYNIFIKSLSSQKAFNREIISNLFTLREIFDNLRVGIAVVDKNFRIVETNNCMRELFGKEPSRAVPCYDFYRQRDTPCEDCPMTGISSLRYDDLIHRSTRDRWLEVHTFPLIQNGGEQDGVVKIIFDVTERVRAEQNREDMERMIQHDIRNGLMGIIGTAQVLLGYPSSRSQQEYIELLHSNALNLKNTINGYLDLYKMETGSFVLNAQAFDLLPLIVRVVKSLKQLASLRNVDCSVLFHDKPLQAEAGLIVRGSPLLIENMFMNLLKNAVEASPPGRTVTVSIIVRGELYVSFHNFGTIPAEILDRFFQKYVTHDKENGLGLGAYSSRIIARAHGGDITFSTSPEQGTRLLVRLPASMVAEGQNKVHT